MGRKWAVNTLNLYLINSNNWATPLIPTWQSIYSSLPWAVVWSNQIACLGFATASGKELMPAYDVSSMLFSFTFSRALPDGAISKILEVAEVSTAVSNLKNGIVQCSLLSNHIPIRQLARSVAPYLKSNKLIWNFLKEKQKLTSSQCLTMIPYYWKEISLAALQVEHSDLLCNVSKLIQYKVGIRKL